MRFRATSAAVCIAAVMAQAVMAQDFMAQGPMAQVPIAQGPMALPNANQFRMSEPAPTDQLMDSGLAAFHRGEHAEAQRIFRLLAGRGVPSAETLLGAMAASGHGGPRDDAVAAAWFIRAARRGYAPAQLALADFFSRGRGVKQDHARARQLARAAAIQGQPGAMQMVVRHSRQKVRLSAREGPDRF